MEAALSSRSSNGRYHGLVSNSVGRPLKKEEEQTAGRQREAGEAELMAVIKDLNNQPVIREDKHFVEYFFITLGFCLL